MIIFLEVSYHLDVEAPGLPLPLGARSLPAGVQAPVARPHAPTDKTLPSEPASTDVPDDTPAQAPGGTPAVLYLSSALNTLAPGGQQAQVLAEVWDRKGNHVPDGVEVTVSTTLGHFAESGTDMVVAETTGGLVRVTLVSGDETGTATVTAVAEATTDTLIFTFRWPYQRYLPLVFKAP